MLQPRKRRPLLPHRMHSRRRPQLRPMAAAAAAAVVVLLLAILGHGTIVVVAQHAAHAGELLVFVSASFLFGSTVACASATEPERQPDAPQSRAAVANADRIPIAIAMCGVVA